MPTHNGKMKAQAHGDDDYVPESATGKGGGGAGRKSKKMKAEEEYCAKPAPGVEEGIEVKTKFPVARIKRIMQADEDVGKVAQVTPTAVCKSPSPRPSYLPSRVRANVCNSKSAGTLHDLRRHKSSYRSPR